MTQQDSKLQMVVLTTILIHYYLKYNPAGGVLHVVLSDANVRDSDIEFCIKEATKKDDIWAETIGSFLLCFTEKGRLQVIDNAKGNLADVGI